MTGETVDLDTLFGFKYVTVGDDDDGRVGRRLKMRVMLTRQQTRVVRKTAEAVRELQRNVNELTKRISEADVEDREAIKRATDEAEELEDRTADTVFDALNVLIIGLPPEYKELSFESLARVFRLVSDAQGLELLDYVKVETGHPTHASNGS